MLFFGSVADRVRQSEVMDDSDLESEQHRRALKGISRLNSLSRSTRIVWEPIAELGRRHATSRLRVLDVATGAGDVAIGLWQKASRAGFQLEILGIDVRSQAVQFARERAAAYKAPVEFSTQDAFSGELPSGFDVVISSLFLHHLDEHHAVLLLERMARAAHRLMLVNDLVRNTSGLVLVGIASRLATTSRVVHVDAMRSVRAAFTLSEVRSLAQDAGLDGVTVVGRWPCRFLLSWSRP